MSDSVQKINVGENIGDRFEVTAIMDDGELGELVLVKELLTGKSMVALQLSFPVTPEHQAELQGLFDSWKAVNHKSLATLNEFIILDETGYILMDNIEGDILSKHLEARRGQEQILGVKAAYGFVSHIGAGLNELHQLNNSYKRLSTRNIFVTSAGRVRLIHPLCPALAEMYLDEKSRAAYFSSPFCAPEVRQNPEDSSPAADVYSLSMLFAELLSPSALDEFGGSPEAFIAKLPNVASNVKEVLFQGVKPDLEDRINSFESLKEMLKRSVDAPADKDISSIVIGMNDLRSLTGAAETPSSANNPVAKRPDKFESGSMARAVSRSAKKNIWIYQKDGMDYGPFDHAGIMEKFKDEVITESTCIFNTNTKASQNLGSIPEFEKEVQEYIPTRNRNRASRIASEQKKARNRRNGIGGVVLIVLLVIMGILMGPIIYFLIIPKPEPIDYSKAFPAFEQKFEAPKTEEYALKMDDSKVKALFDPRASEAEIAAALAAWEEEHRQNTAKHHRAARKTNDDDDDDKPEVLRFTGDDGEDLEPLEDWEIHEQFLHPTAVRKRNECFQKYVGDKHIQVTIKFTIQTSGIVRSLKADSNNAELNACLVSSLASMHYRQFGGISKKVSWPISY